MIRISVDVRFPLHERHIDVQVPVIQWLLDMLLDDVFQVLQIHAVARVLGRNPLHRHVQLVVVAVPVGVGAFAEHFEVLGLVPFVIPQLVGGIESGAAGDVDVLHGSDNRAKVADVPMEYLRAMIVVTGAAGFIGSVLAVRLLEADYRQLVLWTISAWRPNNANHEHLPVTAGWTGRTSPNGWRQRKTKSNSSSTSGHARTPPNKTSNS